MCTGLEIALLVGGTAAAAGGAAITRNDQLENSARIARARNDVLRTLTQRETELETKSRAEGIQKALEHFTPEEQAKAQAEDNTRRDTAITDAVTPTQGVSDVPLENNAPRIVKDQISKKLRDVFEMGIDRAKLAARPLSYRDVLSGNDVVLGNAGRVENTYNSFGRQEAAMLPGQQELAGYAASRTPSIWGPILQAAGQTAAAAGGSGIVKGVGTAASAAAPAAAGALPAGGSAFLTTTPFATTPPVRWPT